jgi:plasmid stabilization system protein ParE
MKVAWSDKAKTRLREIHDYIAQDSPIRAKQVVDRLTRRSERLALDHRVDRRVPEYLREDLREVLDRPFRLIYLVSEERIEIVTVKHYRQRLPELPADL